MSDNINVRFLVAGLMCITLLLSSGCQQQGEAVDLYIDAILLTEFDKDELAVGKLNEAVKVDKKFSYAYSLLGQIYEKMGDYEKSAASYKKATGLRPWSFKDFFSLGRIYEIIKEFAKAVRAYARACEIDPEHLQAHINTAKCYVELKDYDRALTFSRRAEEIDPNVGEVQMLLADIYKSQEDYQGAIRSYKRALEIDSNNPEIMTSLAVAYTRTALYEPAKELLTTVTQIQPDNSKAHQYLGYCQLKLNDPDKAIEAYTSAVRINSRDWEALRALGVAYMLKAIVSDDASLKLKAIEQWRASLDINPNQSNSQMLLRLIWKYSKLR